MEGKRKVGLVYGAATSLRETKRKATRNMLFVVAAGAVLAAHKKHGLSGLGCHAIH